ncbi:type 1 glutamine amidotransferase [Aurantiacibacter rhizosphaerae]|uniref:Type 1 glutamine amidotransferase n=1 Tax=Aurantiacibacter rhizosphaerae TaxID=2691582 RepID=A0A844XDF5_9SPHN|nr:type 1 glutamine amidotransferase [Aurantiacibacter rhizosphaerae]MWV27535.1 type 1 glutamine amidotransferase [Aurantiacibacter rhizosphaerae]
MPRLLLLEGNTAEKRALGAKIGVRSSSQIYAEAISTHFPDLEMDTINGADEDWAFPEGRGFGDYDGMVITGSSLHAYDSEFAVTNQIELTARAGETGMPIFGSCWGLQIAVMAAGGQVEYSPMGREVGIARKITPTDEGRGHPIFSLKNRSFDAPCIHYDEVTRLPDSATLLASNPHSKVQAALVPVGKSTVWAVQYHPEFDLQQLVQLYRLYEDAMITEGFFVDKDSMHAYVRKLDRLIAAPDDMGLRWQLGIDDDILDDRTRNGEIIAWLESEVL